MTIQQYVVDESYLASRLIVGTKRYEGTVDVVLYTDHVDTVAELTILAGKAVAAERARIRAAVEAKDFVYRDEVLAIIDGESD